MRKEFYTGHLFDVYRYFGAHKEGENFIFRFRRRLVSCISTAFTQQMAEG